MLRLIPSSTLLAASRNIVAKSTGAERAVASRAVAGVYNVLGQYLNQGKPTSVVFSLGGGIVPSMYPVFQDYAQKFTIPYNTELIKNKVLMDNDPEVMDAILPWLGSPKGSFGENLADVMDAIQSIKAEGMKAVLVYDPREFKNIPLDIDVFDEIIPELNAEFVEAALGDVVYVDNCPEQLAKAESLGATTVAVSCVNANDPYTGTLEALEGKLQVPLKTLVPGFTFNWFERENMPEEHKGRQIWYWHLFIFGYMVTCYVLFPTPNAVTYEIHGATGVDDSYLFSYADNHPDRVDEPVMEVIRNEDNVPVIYSLMKFLGLF